MRMRLHVAAPKQVAKWQQVFRGVLDSTLCNVGSRTPGWRRAGWATLEVVTGGFAAGEICGKWVIAGA